jgi:hypothetical protein
VETAAYGNSMLSLLSAPPPPSQRGPLARVPREQRVCSVCHSRLAVKGPGALRIERSNGDYRITCGRCLKRDMTRPRRSAIDDERERLFRRRMELLNQKARALGYEGKGV